MSANTSPASPPAHADEPVMRSAVTSNLRPCHHCGTVWEGARDDAHCEVCSSPLHVRKIDSLNRTWAFLIAACIMYIPANLMPVMTTTTLLDEQQDKIGRASCRERVCT